MIELAQARQESDLARLKPLGYTFSKLAADNVRTFFETYLRHYKGEWAGTSVVLEDWEFDDILAPIFGWLRPDGTRRFREAAAQEAAAQVEQKMAPATALRRIIKNHQRRGYEQITPAHTFDITTNFLEVTCPTCTWTEDVIVLVDPVSLDHEVVG